MMGEARVFFDRAKVKKTRIQKNRPKGIIDIDFGGNITQASTGPRPPKPYTARKLSFSSTQMWNVFQKGADGSKVTNIYVRKLHPTGKKGGRARGLEQIWPFQKFEYLNI